MSKSYVEKLKSPKWQKKRLEILKRDNFQCRECGDSDRQLHIHHIIYKKVDAPWKYDNKDLITLCYICHQSFHDEKGAYKKEIRNLVADHSLDHLDIAQILYYSRFIIKEMGVQDYINILIRMTEKAKEESDKGE